MSHEGDVDAPSVIDTETQEKDYKGRTSPSLLGVTGQQQYSHHAEAIPGHHDMKGADIEFRLRPGGAR
jgi:hypothetical protein